MARRTAASERHELSKHDADAIAQERGGAHDAPALGDRISAGFWTATHPDTGLEVTFVPGEALPTWARALQAAPERRDPAQTIVTEAGGDDSTVTGLPGATETQ